MMTTAHDFMRNELTRRFFFNANAAFLFARLLAAAGAGFFPVEAPAALLPFAAG